MFTGNVLRTTAARNGIRSRDEKGFWGSMRAGPLVPSLESRMRSNFSFSTYTFKILRSVLALRVNLGRSGAVPVLVL